MRAPNGLAALGVLASLATGCGASVSGEKPPAPAVGSPTPSASPVWHLPDACALLDPSLGRTILGTLPDRPEQTGGCAWRAEDDPANSIRIVAVEGFAETGEHDMERNTAVVRERYAEMDADDCAPLPAGTACWTPPSQAGMLIVHTVKADVMVTFIAKGPRVAATPDGAARRLAEQAAESILTRL